METEIKRLRDSHEKVGLKEVGNIGGKAVQLKSTNAKEKTGGTLYSTFINITDMEFILIYKLDNNKITKPDLKAEFAKHSKRAINLE